MVWRLVAGQRSVALLSEVVRRSAVWRLGAGQRLVALLSGADRQREAWPSEALQEVVLQLVARAVYCLAQQATATHRT